MDQDNSVIGWLNPFDAFTGHNLRIRKINSDSETGSIREIRMDGIKTLTYRYWRAPPVSPVVVFVNICKRREDIAGLFHGFDHSHLRFPGGHTDSYILPKNG